MNRVIIDKLLHRLLCIKWHNELDTQYAKIIKMNNIKGGGKVHENLWYDKWSQYNVKISPLQYRVFRNYIGDNINIVPEEVCHLIIEPILNSKLASGYYGDKNLFEKILPPSYMPRTLFRKIRGHFYDSEYNPLFLDEKSLRTILERFKRIVLKPAVDGESGRGVMVFVYSESKKNWVEFHSDYILSVDFLKNKLGDDIIVQEAIEQHYDIAKFNKTSVNTLRLSVYRSVKDDKCHVMGAIMRIGATGSIVDNAHAGGCFVGIDNNGHFHHNVLNQYGEIYNNFNGIDFIQIIIILIGNRLQHLH